MHSIRCLYNRGLTPYRVLLRPPPPLQQTNLPTYLVQDVKVRRRFQDFTFLSDQLARDFPACIVPPLPSKSRIGPSPPRSLAVAVAALLLPRSDAPCGCWCDGLTWLTSSVSCV
jgi:hypothetical protein